MQSAHFESSKKGDPHIPVPDPTLILSALHRVPSAAHFERMPLPALGSSQSAYNCSGSSLYVAQKKGRPEAALVCGILLALLTGQAFAPFCEPLESLI